MRASPRPYARVEMLLSAWGRRQVAEMHSGVGWPKCSPGFRDYRSGTAFDGSPPIGVAEALPELEQEIGQLPRVLLVCVWEMWVRGGSEQQISARCGISRPTLRRYLLDAYARLDNVLNAARTA